MCSGRPLSSEILDALKACRDLRALADDRQPFGAARPDVGLKLHDIELLLYRILRDISA